MAHYRSAWHLAWLSLCLGSIGRAAEGPIVLPPVVVPLPPAESAPETPSRRDPSGSMTIIETERYRGEAKDAAELLAPAPGVLIQEFGGLGQAKMPSIRGASSTRVLVLLDGIPLNGSGGNTDLSRIPAAIVERIEVLRGAGARYGSGGLGGVINVVTRQPRGEGRLSAEATQGSFGTTLAQMAASGPLAGGEGVLLLHGAHTRGDFTYLYNDKPELPGNPSVELRRDNNQATLGGALLKYRHGLRERLGMDAMAEVSLESRGLAGTIDNPTPDSTQSSQRFSSQLRLTQSLGGSAELAGRVFVRRDWLHLKGGYFGLGLDEVDSVLGVETTGSVLLGQGHGLTASVLVGRETLRESSNTNPSWSQVGVMALDELLLWQGQVSCIPSIRLDWNGPFFGVSPKLGANLRLPGGFELRANAGQAYRAPSFIELYVAQGATIPNPDLKAERALSADGGLLHRTSFSLLSAGGFYSVYDNLISYEYYPPLLSRPYNFSSARAYGAEAEGELRIRQWVFASVAYTLLFSQNLLDDPRFYLKELPYRPRHRLYARVSLGPELARARAELIYQSAQFVNRTATREIPSRGLINLGVSSQLFSAPELIASLEVKNVTNLFTQDLDGYPLPSRGFYFTLSVALSAKRKEG